MHAHADPLPCHHPKWPRHCPHCDTAALGFNVTVPLEERWDPETKEMRWWAWGASGMACYVCNVVILPDEFTARRSDREGEIHTLVSEAYVRELVMRDVSGIKRIEVVPAAWFEEHCCLPAEGPKDPENAEVKE